MDKFDLAQTTTDPEILDELSRDEDWMVRWRVAYNSNTSPETLDYLSRGQDFVVRYRVAENINTSPETLKQMSIDEDYLYVKHAIKANPNCPLETWKYLSALEIITALPKVSKKTSRTYNKKR